VPHCGTELTLFSVIIGVDLHWNTSGDSFRAAIYDVGKS
jgi:hypothetical protein